VFLIDRPLGSVTRSVRLLAMLACAMFALGLFAPVLLFSLRSPGHDLSLWKLSTLPEKVTTAAAEGFRIAVDFVCS
jgi:hypothetical protein